MTLDKVSTEETLSPQLSGDVGISHTGGHRAVWHYCLLEQEEPGRG